MTGEEFKERFRSLQLTLIALGVVLVMLLGFGALLINDPGYFDNKPEAAEVFQGSDDTGFIEGEHKMLVVANCTGCHSSKLVIQNRASREGWKNMIRWMQQTQNLWDLGGNEEKILDYLSTHYAPEEQGRRANLEIEQWYKLKD